MPELISIIHTIHNEAHIPTEIFLHPDLLEATELLRENERIGNKIQPYSASAMWCKTLIHDKRPMTSFSLPMIIIGGILVTASEYESFGPILNLCRNYT